jgi:hypothetical protein
MKNYLIELFDLVEKISQSENIEANVSYNSWTHGLIVNVVDVSSHLTTDEIKSIYFNTFYAKIDDAEKFQQIKSDLEGLLLPITVQA